MLASPSRMTSALPLPGSHRPGSGSGHNSSLIDLDTSDGELASTASSSPASESESSSSPTSESEGESEGASSRSSSSPHHVPGPPLSATELADKLSMGSLPRRHHPGDSLEPWYASHPTRERHEHLLRAAMDIILDEAVFDGTDRKNKVCEWREPDKLPALIELTLPSGGPMDDDSLLQLVKDTIKYSVKTGHPRFVNQLFSGLDPYGLLGQWLTDALNPSVYTYEVSPVFTLMEEAVLREMRRIVGFPTDQGDGIFCPGGSMANGYGISCARYHLFPEVKTRGMHGIPRLVLFTSEDAHYSVKKMATLFGIGADNVVLVRTDALGRMDPRHLEQLVAEARALGGAPFFVSATAGTTVLGAFDPIDDIADVCSRNNMWLHVDAAWGGGALMSKKHRTLLKGIERADSVTWNPHKLLAAPQQCSTFLTRHGGLLGAAHSASAAYLFQPDKFYDTRFDTGDKHVQCGRRADVLKFWFMWKAKGTLGLEQHIDHLWDTAAYFVKAVRSRPGWELVLAEPQCTNICFWYIPPSLRGLRDHCDYSTQLGKVAPRIKERMMKQGTMMVTYQPLPSRGLPNFFRLVLQSSGTTTDDMDFFIAEIERLGADL